MYKILIAIRMILSIILGFIGAAMISHLSRGIIDIPSVLDGGIVILLFIGLTTIIYLDLDQIKFFKNATIPEKDRHHSLKFEDHDTKFKSKYYYPKHALYIALSIYATYSIVNDVIRMS
ncbi:MAG: hypothetical protein HOH19_04215 [Kordiimonadaceae bacterium]|nr:hypothetical protein [Kordiimonadaceae bacterium]MBT6031756.1 hypothetical protein [Kordiimonadaceae bacterium]